MRLFNIYSALPLFALCIAVIAAPAPADTSLETPFTFSSWIEAIIANPSGSHLTAAEAVAVANISQAVATRAKRQRQVFVWCEEQTPTWLPANVSILCAYMIS